MIAKSANQQAREEQRRADKEARKVATAKAKAERAEVKVSKGTVVPVTAPDVSPTGGRILSAISDRGAATPEEISRAVGITLAEVRSECGALIQGGELRMGERDGHAVYIERWSLVRSGETEVVAAKAFAKPKAKPAFRLSAKQRADLFRGGHPRIAFPRLAWKKQKATKKKKAKKVRELKPCPIAAGDVYELSSQVAIGITGISISKGTTEWELQYTVLDNRARLLLAGAHAVDFEAWRREHKQMEPLDSQGQEDAAEASAYTPSSHAALPCEPEAVPRDYQRRISETAAIKAARPTTASVKAREAEQKVRDEFMKGKPGVLAKAAAKRAARRAEEAA